MKNLIIIVSIFCLSLFLTECKSTKTATTTISKEETKTVKPADDAAVSAGQMLFTTKCDRCHKQPKANLHDDVGWRATMSTMGPKAHLSDAETAQVLKYLSAANSK